MKLKVLALVVATVLVFSACSQGEQNTAQLDKSSIDTTIGDFEGGSASDTADSSQNTSEPTGDTTDGDSPSGADDANTSPDGQNTEIDDNSSPTIGNDTNLSYTTKNSQDGVPDPNQDIYDEYKIRSQTMEKEIVMANSALDIKQIEIPDEIDGNTDVHIMGIYDETSVMVNISLIERSPDPDDYSTRILNEEIGLYDFVSGQYTKLLDFNAPQNRYYSVQSYSSDYIVYADSFIYAQGGISVSTPEDSPPPPVYGDYYLIAFNIHTGELTTVHEYNKNAFDDFPLYTHFATPVIDGDKVYYNIVSHIDSSFSLGSVSYSYQDSSSNNSGVPYTTYCYDIKNKKLVSTMEGKHSPMMYGDEVITLGKSTDGRNHIYDLSGRAIATYDNYSTIFASGDNLFVVLTSSTPPQDGFVSGSDERYNIIMNAVSGDVILNSDYKISSIDGNGSYLTWQQDGRLSRNIILYSVEHDKFVMFDELMEKYEDELYFFYFNQLSENEGIIRLISDFDEANGYDFNYYYFTVN